jgi:hypothetical protein
MISRSWYPRWLAPWLCRILLILLASLIGTQAEEYPLGPDSQFNPSVPHGTVTRHVFTATVNSLFPGTRRDYWVYVPKQYSPTKPACLMVFQDGGGYVSTNGSFRAPIVFDNLIARGEMPVTVGVFINPGVLPSAQGTNALPRYNRSYEYDGLGDRYARFLAEELLPEVRKTVAFTDDPNGRAIAGASSGAIAAFTFTAWFGQCAFAVAPTPPPASVGSSTFTCAGPSAEAFIPNRATAFGFAAACCIPAGLCASAFAFAAD